MKVVGVFVRFRAPLHEQRFPLFGQPSGVQKCVMRP
jgi:hypothetical protein